MSDSSRAQVDRLAGIIEREKLSDEIDRLQRWQPPKFRSKPTVIGTLVGVATPVDATVNIRGKNGLSSAERYAPGCFRDSLRRLDQSLRLNHEAPIPGRYRQIEEWYPGRVRQQAGELAELRFSFDVFDSAIGRTTLAGIRAGVV